MIKSEKALKIVLKQAKPLGTEFVELDQTFGRVLAQNIYSDVFVPPFNRSAMDGFAVNSKDPAQAFEIIEDIPAGYVPKKKIRFGQCARIMTGAMLPKGADKVIKVEDVKEPRLSAAGSLMQVVRREAKSNVSPKGEDIRKGELVLKKGTKIRPQEAAILATVGETKIKVYKQPGVAIISTGSELVEPDKKPMRGQIRNSNSSMLLLQLKRLGINGKYYGIARDNFNETQRLIRKALNESDILLLSGGVSVGDYDFVPEVLKKCGVKIRFNKVAIKPGKPTTFGYKKKKVVFGLPGNPVSVLVIFELFVVPFINKLVKRETANKFRSYTILSTFKRKRPERDQYYPVIIKGEKIMPVEFHGSAHMRALTKANGLMYIESGKTEIKKGGDVLARPI